MRLFYIDVSSFFKRIESAGHDEKHWNSIVCLIRPEGKFEHHRWNYAAHTSSAFTGIADLCFLKTPSDVRADQPELTARLSSIAISRRILAIPEGMTV